MSDLYLFHLQKKILYFQTFLQLFLFTSILRLFYNIQNKEFGIFLKSEALIHLCILIFQCVLLSFIEIKENLPLIWWILKDFKMITHQSQGAPNLNSILFDFKMLMKMAVSMQQHLAHYNIPF